MIPILYDKAEKSFEANGIGRLSDCLSCVITEERNGEYTGILVYPLHGIFAESIEANSIIKVKLKDRVRPQLFYVHDIVKDMTTITVLLNHISYRLCGIPVQPFTASGIESAVMSIDKNTLTPCDFRFGTDLKTTGTYKLDTPRSAKAVLGGMDGSILDVYGQGEFEWDNFVVRLWKERGEDTGVSIRYGKNMTDIELSGDVDSTYNGVVAYWYREEDGTVWSDARYNTSLGYPYNYLKVHDASFDIDSKPTKAELNTVAEKEAQKLLNHSESISVSFASLRQMGEYDLISALERTRLCDIVTVVHPGLNINVKRKIVKTVYNVLNEQYDEITIGVGRSSLADTLLEMKEEQEKFPIESISGLSDYVVASGKSSTLNKDASILTGNIYWQKWFSGKLEVYGWSRYNGNASIKTAYGGGYITASAMQPWGGYPIKFIEPPAVDVRISRSDSGYTGNYSIVYQSIAHTDTSVLSKFPVVRVWSGESLTFGHPQFTFKAVGRWK